MTALPAELAWLPSLRILHLAENDMTSVPPAVFELAELEALGLGANPARHVAGRGRRSARFTLWMTRNPLRELPRALTRLASLPPPG